VGWFSKTRRAFLQNTHIEGVLRFTGRWIRDRAPRSDCPLANRYAIPTVGSPIGGCDLKTYDLISRVHPSIDGRDGSIAQPVRLDDLGRAD
jgi:hypothetical protein